MEPNSSIWLPSLVVSVLFIVAWGAQTWLLTYAKSACIRRKPARSGAGNVATGASVHNSAASVDCNTPNAAQQQEEQKGWVLVQVLTSQVEPMHIEWQGIGCSYHLGSSTKVVLQDVWGKAHPGQMQALMGPSGAGKSTLMEDTFIPTMTCEETLRFYAAVVLPDTCSRSQLRARVQEVLGSVGLSSANKTLVGGTLPGGMNLRGLSGGERRRLSIAAGILPAPSVLFLDEPTSGLDSFAALNVMGHLQNVAQATQQTVIATIHQPRSAIWEMFDTVSLLSAGRLMYHGPCTGMVPWFESLGHLHTKGSESDWVLDLVATGFNKPPELFEHSMRTQEDITRAAAMFKQDYLASNKSVLGGADGSDISRDGDQDVPGHGMLRSSSTQSNLSQLALRVTNLITGNKGLVSEVTSSRPTYAAGWLRQFGALYSRELASITRNPADVIGRQVTFTVMGLVCGLTFYQLDVGTFEALQARTNLIFFNMIALVVLPFVSLSLYTNDKKMYLADASSKLYRPSCFYLAKVMYSTPFHMLSAVTYGGITYGMGGLRAGADPFARYSLILTLVFLISSQVLHLSTIITPNFDAAFALALLWCTPQILCSSYFVRYAQAGLQWFTQLRFLTAGYFAMEALVQNELHGSSLDCSQGFDKRLMAFIKSGLVSANTVQRSVIDQMSKPQPGCTFDTDAVAKLLGYSYSFALAAGCLVAYLLVLHVLTFLALALVARRERR